jgi:hypothetical protein
MHQLLTPEILSTCRPQSNDDRLRTWQRKKDLRRRIIRELIRRALLDAMRSQQSAPDLPTTHLTTPSVRIPARSSSGVRS